MEMFIGKNLAGAWGRLEGAIRELRRRVEGADKELSPDSGEAEGSSGEIRGPTLDSHR
jgi:hypothetical protein